MRGGFSGGEKVSGGFVRSSFRFVTPLAGLVSHITSRRIRWCFIDGCLFCFCEWPCEELHQRKQPKYNTNGRRRPKDWLRKFHTRLVDNNYVLSRWRQSRMRLARMMSIPSTCPGTPPLVLRFADSQHLISAHVAQGFDDSRRPVDLHHVCLGVCAESKVYRAIARGRVSHAGGHVVVLRAHGFAHDFNPRANAVAVAPGASQRNLQPVSGVRAAVHP